MHLMFIVYVYPVEVEMLLNGEHYLKIIIRKKSILKLSTRKLIKCFIHNIWSSDSIIHNRELSFKKYFLKYLVNIRGLGEYS